MNQAVRTPGEVHQVLAKLRVSGDDHRVTRGIDAISKCWVHSSMIDEERGGSRRTVIIYFILLYFFRIDFDAFSWKGIRRGLTNANIKGKCLSKVLRHTGSSFRTPDSKRFASPQKPSRKPQIRDSHNMVGVKMSEKETVYLFRANSSLGQANYDTATTVKQQFLARRFDKNGRAESLNIRKGSSCTE